MLTKSDFIKYLQCYKYLWLYKNRKDLIPAEYADRFAKIFGEGFKVEDYAYKLFPGGIDAYDQDFKTAISRSKDLINKKTAVIFQPTISGSQLFSRADIIKYDAKKGCWDIYEIKGSLDVQDIHIADLAFQKVCLETNGLTIGRLFIIHVNRDFVRRGDIKPEEFLTTEEVTEQVTDLVKETKDQIKEALLVLQKTKEPDIRILRQCSDPHECMFTDYCWKDVPENSIYDISHGLSEDKLNQLIDEGIIHIKDIPEGFLSHHRAILHHKVLTQNILHLEKDKISQELSQLKYPLYFLDYETYGFQDAIPMFDGYRPYSQITFQYSLHIQAKPGAKLEHYEYLADKFTEPSLGLVEELSRRIKKGGTVIAYNMAFEKGRNAEMARLHPLYASFLNAVNDRMFDLYEIFKKGYYVHRDFQGSASLKKVLPVLVPALSYQELNIREGQTASDSWRKMIEPGTSAKDRKQIRDDLLKYCKLDTLAMVEILKELIKISKQSF